MKTYEELCAERPEYQGVDVNAELYALCLWLDPAIPTHLIKWFTYQKWWKSLSRPEKKSILDKEWRYD